MKLFDDITRNDSRPARYAEPNFDYLNRSARPECERIRNLLEQWFERFPSEVQSELCSRFRNKNDRQHASAFFELYLHELLSRLKFDIEFHPQMERKRTHPDFMVLKGKEQLFYLEATLVTLSDTKAATKARENRVYDTLDEMKSPNFFINLKVHGAPNSSPPGRKIRDFLERQLAGLNPEKIVTQFEQSGFRGLPSWKWEYEGWQITFFPIPKSPSNRGKPGIRPIGKRMQEPKWVTPHIGIRNSIYDKASKYGKLSLPYVVAINVIDESGANDIDISNALFGEEQLTVVLRRNVLVSQVKGRKPNGAWYGQNGPQNKRVSAVLIAVNLCPWSITKTTPILWHNPWANYTLSQDVWSPSQVVPDIENNRLVKRDGKRNWKLLGLYPNWPNTCKDA